jgi:hypothetical protein
MSTVSLSVVARARDPVTPIWMSMEISRCYLELMIVMEDISRWDMSVFIRLYMNEYQKVPGEASEC